MTYSKESLALMFLSSLPFYTNNKGDAILECLDGDGTKLFKLSFDDRDKLKQTLEKNDFDVLLRELKKFDENAFVKKLDNRNIKCITCLDDDYPSDLRSLTEPPKTIYYVGDRSLLNKICISVVGTRSPTVYGRTITEKMINDMVIQGVVVVSGMACGIDQIAHESALKFGGKTIAVLGSGFDHVYPSANINLARTIAQNGLLMTEYYPTAKATRYSFPARNRIIAAISKGVLITEAGPNSGTIYTKEYALELCKDIYAVPGSILSEKSQMTNELIKNGECYVVTDADDVLFKYGLQKKGVTRQKLDQLSIEELSIVSVLKRDGISFDELQESTKIPTKNLLSYLTTLEIRGIIKKVRNNYYLLFQ